MGCYEIFDSVALDQLITGSIWIIDKSNVNKVKRYFLFGLITVPLTFYVIYVSLFIFLCHIHKETQLKTK